MRITKSVALRVVIPLAVLAVFGAGLALVSRRTTVAKPVKVELTQEQSRALADDAKNLLRDQKYEPALTPLLKLHEAYPDNHIYIGQLASAYKNLGRYREEAQFWEKYFDRAPRPVAACPDIGLAYWKQGPEHRNEALNAYERCLALNPDNADSIFFLAHALEMMGELDRAEQLYTKGVQVSPGYVDMQLGLARIWFRQDRVAEAKAAAQKILAKGSDRVDALLLMGMISSHQNDYRHAKEYLQAGIKLSPSYTDFYIALARVAEAEKDYPEAVRQYDKILELRPEDDRVRARREQLVAMLKK